MCLLYAFCRNTESSTWILMTEVVTEQPKRLAEECKTIAIRDGDFLVSDVGET
ncbi:hypothetical protein EDD85DRAFT_776225 [Armillaria nabsnona]|nr:hypothetical protein EDD85DRAFT_776225 [Armillaria nabsnona]